MDSVVLENVCKVFPGDVVAVKDADFPIEDREIVIAVDMRKAHFFNPETGRAPA